MEPPLLPPTCASATRERTLPRLLEQLAADQHAPDLARAGADLIELGIAQIASRGIIVDVAVAAEELDCVKRDLRCILRRVKNGAGCVLARGLAAIAGP